MRVLYNMMKEWMTITHTLQNYTSLFITRKEDGRCRLAEDCYIDAYPPDHIDPTLRAPLSTHSASRQGPHCFPPRVAPDATSTLAWSWLQQADHDWPCLTVGTCVYAFFQFVIRMIFLHPRIICFPVIASFTQLEHPVPEVPDWRLGQKSICNKRQLLYYNFSVLSF